MLAVGILAPGLVRYQPSCMGRDSVLFFQTETDYDPSGWISGSSLRATHAPGGVPPPDWVICGPSGPAFLRPVRPGWRASCPKTRDDILSSLTRQRARKLRGRLRVVGIPPKNRRAFCPPTEKAASRRPIET